MSSTPQTYMQGYIKYCTLSNVKALMVFFFFLHQCSIFLWQQTGQSVPQGNLVSTNAGISVLMAFPNQ